MPRLRYGPERWIFRSQWCILLRKGCLAARAAAVDGKWRSSQTTIGSNLGTSSRSPCRRLWLARRQKTRPEASNGEEDDETGYDVMGIESPAHLIFPAPGQYHNYNQSQATQFYFLYRGIPSPRIINQQRQSRLFFFLFILHSHSDTHRCPCLWSRSFYFYWI